MITYIIIGIIIWYLIGSFGTLIYMYFTYEEIDTEIIITAFTRFGFFGIAAILLFILLELLDKLNKHLPIQRKRKEKK